LGQQQIKTPAPIILAIDTSSKTTSLALARGRALIKSQRSPADETRSEKLWTEIGSLLGEAGMAIRDVELFSVCTGPGGFTGLRVGMAAVKGFAAAMNRPIACVTSLEAAAYSACAAKRVCAVVNAYKGEVYSQLFTFDAEGMPLAENEPFVSSLERALDRVAGIEELIFSGDAAESLAEITIRRGAMKWRVKRADHCLAEDVASLAFIKYSRDWLETAASARACYVRPAEAEIKLSLGLLGSKIKRSMKSE
jgi:tRNA threonylcarbamoyl adenosine modification protein YeaZ